MAISEKKLRSLSLKLKSFVPESQTPTDTYVTFMQLANKQAEYFFNYLGYKNTLKIIINIWSLNQTGSFSLAEKIFKNLEFITLISHEGEFKTEECDKCESTGYELCPKCDGNETIECPSCHGLGCRRCKSQGEIPCPDHREQIKCDKCDGEGEYETNETNLDIRFILSWNKFINDKAKETEQTLEPLIDNTDLIDYEQNYILLSSPELYHHLKIDPEMKPGFYYVMNIDDDPNIIIFNKLMSLKTPWRNFQVYESDDK